MDTGTERPIFIGGCPRSGTTLLGSMLGNHSGLICVPESQFKTKFLEEWDTATPAERKRLLFWLEKNQRCKDWDLPDIREILDGKKNPRTGSEVIQTLVRTYARKAGKTAHRIWVDHTPANLRDAVLLNRTFRDAHFVHIVRDGRAVAHSLQPLDWGPSTVYKAAKFWVEHVALGLATEAFLGDNHVKRVRYEDLLRRPSETMSALSEFLDIPFEISTVDPGGFHLPAYTSKQHDKINQQLDSGRVDVWKRNLSPREIELFESRSTSLLEMLGYETLHGAGGQGPSPPERLLIELREMWEWPRKFIRKRFRRSRHTGWLSTCASVFGPRGMSLK